MAFLTPIVIGDIVLGTAIVLWVVYVLFIQRKDMAFKGDFNILAMLPPLLFVGYGIWYVVTSPSPEAVAVLLIAIGIFVYFGLNAGGITEKGIVGTGGLVTEWERIKAIWYQPTRDKNLAIMYTTHGMPGVRHFRMVGNDRKNVSRFIKKYWGQAPADKKPE